MRQAGADPEDFEMFKEGVQGFDARYLVHHINSGHNCLETAKLLTFDLIFLDINMPGLTGVECLAAIKSDQELKEVPVVMYTTSSQKISVQECYDLRAARYLLKPVTYAGIFEGVKFILNLFLAGRLATPAIEEFVIDTFKWSDQGH